MKKNILFLLLLIIPGHSLLAQKHVYDDLLVLYVDEDYEKCIMKADRYINNKDTRRDPLPYLYMSKCYHEMSKLEEYTSQDEYKKADREALKYAVKFRKKDKELEHYGHHEDYWRELNTYAMEAGQMWYELEKYAKARMIFSRMVGYDPDNPGAWQMLAVCQSKSRMEREAKESMKRFHEALEAAREADPQLRTLDEDQQALMKSAMIMHSEHLQDNGMRDSARVVLGLGAEHFADDPEFKVVYEEVN